MKVMKIEGKNFISENVSKKDIDLFFGPVDDEEFIVMQPNWCMAHILHNIKVFTSISQARKNGWNNHIPWGFTKLTLGKKAKKQDIFVLNVEGKNDNE